MLWFPDKAARKKLARIKRLRRRRRIGRLLLFVTLIFVLRAASVPPANDLQVQVDALTRPYQFDFVDWISQAVVSEVERRFSSSALPPTAAGQRALVEQYLQLEERIRGLEQDIEQIYATAGSSRQASQNTAALTQELDRLKAEQANIIPLVETIISNQIEAVLRDEGFAMAGQVFPPVAFRLVDPPTMLILSPRDKIERKYFRGLAPGLETSLRTDIEDTLHQRGDISGYVTDIGGLGSYPTMVLNYTRLPALIDTTAHEWAHNYFYTFPSNIAWGYGNDPHLTTINETAASLVGEEVSRKVIGRFYPEWVDQLPPLDKTTGQPEPVQPSEFHLAMRTIRQRVDDLLAQGKIEQAENFMESERVKLVKKGYNLRRLNQAYFAFHGSYALSPGSIDPTGPQIRQLRAVSPSLKDFLDRVGWLNSYSDYLQWLDEAGVARK